MKKIKITTVSTTAEVQMIALNAHFITKAVKALHTLKQIADDVKEQEKFIEEHKRKDIKGIEFTIEGFKKDLQPYLDFLDELVSALEE